MFSVTTSNAEFYQWQSNLIDLPGQTSTSLILSNVVVDDSAAYRVVVSNASSSLTSSNAVLVVGFPVGITQQPSNLDVSTGTPVTLLVEAAGEPAPQFQWLLNNSNLPGQTNADLVLEAATTHSAGTYSVVVSNAFGAQISSNAVLTVEPLTSIIKENLTVTINPADAGTVSPNLNGKSLLVAHSYTVTAVADGGRVFAHWSGIAQSDDRSLTFVMPSASNAILTANFIPSPFASNGVAGAYAGLFWDTNNLSNETAGWFSANVTTNGVIAGQVKIAGVSILFSAVLRADGSAVLELKRHDQRSLILALQVDLSGLEMLTGLVSDTNGFNAQLIARRSGFSTSSRATGFEGYHTWAIPGLAEDAPAGYSFGTAAITAAGGVHLSVFLSDGATATASGSLSTNGQMPLYVSLYGGKGSLLSWLSFANSPGSLTTNRAFWFKDMVANGPYSNGFTQTNLPLWMGAYTAEGQGTNALNSANVFVEFSGADLTNSIAKAIALDENGIGGSFTNVVVTISDSPGVFTGLGAGIFTGLFQDPAFGRTIRFNGAILRPLAAGFGFFTSGDLSGAVLIEPQQQIDNQHD